MPRRKGTPSQERRRRSQRANTARKKTAAAKEAAEAQRAAGTAVPFGGGVGSPPSRVTSETVIRGPLPTVTRRPSVPPAGTRPGRLSPLPGPIRPLPGLLTDFSVGGQGGPGAAAASGTQVAAAEGSIASLLETYSGKGWPTTSERVRQMFKKAGLIENLEEISDKVAGSAAKRFKDLAASARSSNTAKTHLGSIIEEVTGLRTKGASINAAVAEAMGLKGLLRRIAGSTIGKGVLGLGALAAFEAPEFAGGLLESRREIGAIDEAIASAQRGDPGSLLPTVQDLVDQEKLQYLQQANMARVLAAGGLSPSQVSGTLPLPSDRSAQVPTTVSIPASAGFPG